ncbi:G-protein (beta)-like protein [Strigomonas culicis]|uniref:G-protein (Beta)-like protein n=1 Tax=Strigomonas culicis TaxID=28005 RepID=S9TMS1_9TRYP|nr:G-protein (beta)-like protein [Strigomonas culicis]|eukprot:EPY19562.1 G-protein (beta)-like protein [Strigomonas culicis]
MKITVDVEIPESEFARAPFVQKALEGLNPQVHTRFVTDKEALCARIQESIKQKKYNAISTELTSRLNFLPAAEDALKCMCSAGLFSVQRVEWGEPVTPFIDIIKHIPSPLKDKLKAEIVREAMEFLSKSRYLDCSRLPIIPYAETLAAMTQADLLNVRSAIVTITQMVRLDTTRTAGITCLGKLVEMAFEKIRQCDMQIFETINAALAYAQRDDFFVYDLEYVISALGGSQNKSSLSLRRSGTHHKSSILSLAYSGPGSTREIVVSSSADGSIATWDGSGQLLQNVILSRHYASSLDLSSRGRALIVGTVGTKGDVPPAVIIYEAVHDNHWEERDAVEPKDAVFVTAVKSIRAATQLRYLVAVNTPAANPLLLYDRKQLVQEYTNHTDIITSVFVPPDRDTTVITGSRDCTVALYDTRSRQRTATIKSHFNSVTALGIFGENCLFTGGLDKRVVVDDMRMLGHQPTCCDMDSAVLSLSVASPTQCAVSTLTGVHVINFSNGNMLPATSRADSGTQSSCYNSLVWNSNGSVLYAGGDSTTLDLYVKTFDGDFESA